MTAHKVIILECDGCGDRIPESDELIFPGSHPDSVVGARHGAGIRGWRHTASGKDLCPVCQTAKRSPVKSGGLLSKIPHPHWHR